MASSSVGDDETLRSEGLSSSPPVVDTPDTDVGPQELKPDNDNTEANLARVASGADAQNNNDSRRGNDSPAQDGAAEDKDEEKKEEENNSRPPSPRPRTASSVSSDEDSDNESPWITNLKSSSSLAKGMAKGIVNYTRQLENRIQTLEAAELERTRKEEEEARRKADIKEEPAKEEEKPENAGPELLLETKFYDAQAEFNSDGTWKSNNIDVPGAFQCRTDPKRLIRVLYNWKDDVQPRPLGDEPPRPNEIEILFISIQSDPIADFFSKRLNLKADKAGVVRMGKPFRPLLRNLDPLGDQLSELIKTYPQKPTDAEEGSDEAKEPAETPTPNENGNSNASEAEDPLPFAAPKEEEKESFDTETALPHFRFLFDFISQYLGEQVDLMRRLRLGQEQKIAFEDLWMIFDAGDTIYCPSHEGGVAVGEDHTTKPRYVPQIFRVLGAIGGLRLRKTLAPKGNNAINQYDELFGDQLFTAPSIRWNWTKLQAGTSNVASRRARDQLTPMYVVCFHVDFDGLKYGTVREIFTFKPFDGLMDIRSLEAYPTQYLVPEPDARDTYLERGRKFINVMAVSHMSYEGLTVGKSREEINSAVIIDFKLAFQEYGHAFADGESVVPKMTSLTDNWPSPQGIEIHQYYNNTCSVPWCHQSSCLLDVYADWYLVQAQKVAPKIKALLEEYESSKFQTAESLEDLKQYMEEKDLIRLLPGTVPGFALRNRKWVQLDLELLEKLEQGDDWHKLVLPPGHRKMVQAMVETHTRGSQEPMWAGSSHQGKVAMDLVQGKGRGCIILLHGVPGVGKTSTAETVASYTQRPLYPITCGDIGYVPEAVEENMEEHFKLAHKWGCVLLLDEADVFLAKRTKGDVKRNGLVSVFLRILEYYSGILFLTTNRVGAIDDAFRSRLHLTLYYPKLTENQTTKIWKNNLNRLKDINRAREQNSLSPIDFDKKKILKWVDKNWKTLSWNGRQIRNAFQTAVALAEFEAKVGDDVGSRRKSSAKSSSSSSSKKINPPDSPRAPVMKVDHFKLIADASMQFNEYLEETHGYDEDRMAHRDEIRAPVAFTPKKVKPGLKEIEEVESSSEESSSSSSSSSSDEEDSGEESDDESDVKEGGLKDGSSGESGSDSEGEVKKRMGKGKKERGEGKTKSKGIGKGKEGDKTKKDKRKKDR